MREFLITKMVCSRCGTNLKLTYDTPKGAGKYADGEPTGSAMVQQVVAVEPCECVTSRLDEMRHAAMVLLHNATVSGPEPLLAKVRSTNGLGGTEDK